MAMILIEKSVIERVVRDMEVIKLHLNYLPESLRDVTDKLTADITEIRKNITEPVKIEKR